MTPPRNSVHRHAGVRGVLLQGGLRMSACYGRSAKLQALKSASKPTLFELLLDHRSPTLESQPVLTKPLRQFFAPSIESKLSSSAAHLPKSCCTGGRAACQSRWGSQP